MVALYLDDLASVCVTYSCLRSCMLMIFLLTAPTVSELEALLHICERELQRLDM